jgi:hypothetical protein
MPKDLSLKSRDDLMIPAPVLHKLGKSLIRDLRACKNSKNYKGTRAPACNGGEGCIACWKKRAAYFKHALDRC